MSVRTFTAITITFLMLAGCQVMPQVIGDDALPNQQGRYYTIVIQNHIRKQQLQQGSDAPKITVEIINDPKGLKEQGYAQCMMPQIKRASPKERFLHPKWLYERLPELQPANRSPDDLAKFAQNTSGVEVAKSLGLRFLISLDITNEFDDISRGGWVGGGGIPPIGIQADNGTRVTSVRATIHDLEHPDHPYDIDVKVAKPHWFGLLIVIPAWHLPNTESEACEQLGQLVGKYLNSVDSTASYSEMPNIPK